MEKLEKDGITKKEGFMFYKVTKVSDLKFMAEFTYRPAYSQTLSHQPDYKVVYTFSKDMKKIIRSMSK